ncbi:MAG: hypothetical protein P8O70_09970 [SAR324 cluster bacterium]|nr:hypothetical protein [SAR324 cluster bacterium]
MSNNAVGVRSVRRQAPVHIRSCCPIADGDVVTAGGGGRAIGCVVDRVAAHSSWATPVERHLLIPCRSTCNGSCALSTVGNIHRKGAALPMNPIGSVTGAVGDVDVG